MQSQPVAVRYHRSERIPAAVGVRSDKVVGCQRPGFFELNVGQSRRCLAPDQEVHQFRGAGEVEVGEPSRVHSGSPGSEGLHEFVHPLKVGSVNGAIRMIKKACEPACGQRAILRNGQRESPPIGFARTGTGKSLQQEGQVLGPAGDRARDVDVLVSGAAPQGISCKGDRVPGGFQPVHPAIVCGNADRTTLVGADIGASHSAGHRSGAAPGGSSGTAVRVPGVSRRAEEPVMGLPVRQPLRDVRFSQNHGAVG